MNQSANATPVATEQSVADIMKSVVDDLSQSANSYGILIFSPPSIEAMQHKCILIDGAYVEGRFVAGVAYYLLDNEKMEVRLGADYVEIVYKTIQVDSESQTVLASFDQIGLIDRRVVGDAGNRNILYAWGASVIPHFKKLELFRGYNTPATMGVWQPSELTSATSNTKNGVFWGGPVETDNNLIHTDLKVALELVWGAKV